jgi:DNA-dependent RNA polymerase auxiliary subunit epsilon
MERTWTMTAEATQHNAAIKDMGELAYTINYNYTIPAFTMNIKLFDTFKYYLSSLTARKCPFYFFGIEKDTIIATNGNIIKKNNLLLEYCSPDLSIHRISFKNDFYHLLIKTFGIPTDKIFRLFTKPLCSFLTRIVNDVKKLSKDNKHIEFKTHIDNENNFIITYNNETEVIGDIFDNYIATLSLIKVIDYVKALMKDNINEIKISNFKENISYLHVDINGIKVKITLFDGLDNVSVKEFVKKQEGVYTFNVCYWFLDNNRVEFITKFDNEILSVESFKPHFRIFSLDKDKII